MTAILSINPLNAGPFPTQDPFLFCVYHKDDYPQAKNDMMESPTRGNGQDFSPHAPYRMYHGDTIPGFPQHPHRGFETITATIDGLIDHCDSEGNAGRYGQGDVQWMTAGKGIVHSEMFPLIHTEQANPLRFFQIWINLPGRNKMVDPEFAMFWAENVQAWSSDDGLSSITVWFGDYFLQPEEKALADKNNRPPRNSWASDPENDVAILHIVVQPGGKVTLPKARIDNVNRTLYLIEGIESARIGDQGFSQPSLIVVDGQQEIELSAIDSASGPTEFLLLQGKPIAEPVAQYGPFVMNTENEIRQAFADYQRTQFGGWPWERNDMVFPRDKGRFALTGGNEVSPEAD